MMKRVREKKVSIYLPRPTTLTEGDFFTVTSPDIDTGIRVNVIQYNTWIVFRETFDWRKIKKRANTERYRI